MEALYGLPLEGCGRTRAAWAALIYPDARVAALAALSHSLARA